MSKWTNRWIDEKQMHWLVDEEQIHEWMSANIHVCIHTCRGEMACDNNFSPARIWILSLGFFFNVHSCISKYSLAIAHWITWHYFKLTLKLNSLISHPVPNTKSSSLPPNFCHYSLLKAPPLLIITQGKILEFPLPPTSREPPHLLRYPGLFISFSKYLLFCPSLVMPSMTILELTLARALPLCHTACGWDAMPKSSILAIYPWNKSQAP